MLLRSSGLYCCPPLLPLPTVPLRRSPSTPTERRNPPKSLAEEAQLNLVKRWAEPEEMAEWIAFTVGPKGSYMTGQLLCPNGGDPIVGI